MSEYADLLASRNEWESRAVADGELAAAHRRQVIKMTEHMLDVAQGLADLAVSVANVTELLGEQLRQVRDAGEAAP